MKPGAKTVKPKPLQARPTTAKNQKVVEAAPAKVEESGKKIDFNYLMSIVNQDQ